MTIGAITDPFYQAQWLLYSLEKTHHKMFRFNDLSKKQKSSIRSRLLKIFYLDRKVINTTLSIWSFMLLVSRFRWVSRYNVPLCQSICLLFQNSKQHFNLDAVTQRTGVKTNLLASFRHLWLCSCNCKVSQRAPSLGNHYQISLKQ